MKIKTDDFRVHEGTKVDLKRWPTCVRPFYTSKDDYQKILDEQIQQLSHLQTLHFASRRNALLLILQGMDASGKDGTIQHVMSGVNPQGCDVYAFKQPTPTELLHDFLWRTTLVLPERGMIGIFNRSYYEEVLITRVHPEILAAEPLKNDVHTPRGKNAFWQDRYRSIRDQEIHLHRNGTQIIKVFLHLSKEEQRKRFLSRIDDPDKNWKLSLADIRERSFWNKYQKAYEKCLSKTSTRHSPWYVVPADDKWNARLIVSRILIETLEGFRMKYPKADAKRVKELKTIRKQLL